MSFTEASAKRAVVGALAVTAAVSTAKKVTKGEWPSPRPIIGAVGAAIILSAIAGPAPSVAGGVAVMLGFVSVIDGGADVWGALGQGVSKERPQRARELNADASSILRNPNAPVLPPISREEALRQANRLGLLGRDGRLPGEGDASQIVARGF